MFLHCLYKHLMQPSENEQTKESRIGKQLKRLFSVFSSLIIDFLIADLFNNYFLSIPDVETRFSRMIYAHTANGVPYIIIAVLAHYFFYGTGGVLYNNLFELSTQLRGDFINHVIIFPVFVEVKFLVHGQITSYTT